MNNLESELKKEYTKISELEHPFPNEEIELLCRIHESNLLSQYDYNVISNLLFKYINLRADIFHGI